MRDDIAHAHQHAMAAKEQVFLAQDAVSRAWHAEVNAPTQSQDPRRRRVLGKIEKRLARVRAELEQLDTVVLQAQQNGEVLR